MALDDVLRHIDREADAEIARIEERARADAETLLQAAREDAARLRRELLGGESAVAAAQRRRLLREAAEEAAKIRCEAREEVFQAALDEARRRLARAREDPGYAGTLRALVAEALEAVPQAAAVRADPRDADTVAGLVATHGLTVDPCLATWGGVEVATADGRVVARNTLEARLAQAGPYLRALASRAAPAAEVQEVNAC